MIRPLLELVYYKLFRCVILIVFISTLLLLFHCLMLVRALRRVSVK